MAKIVRVEPHKVKRRKYGAWCYQDNGVNVYCAFRKHNDIYAGKSGKISDAMRNDQAYWAIDLKTLMAAKAKKISVIAVRVKETRDIYAVRIEKFLDRTKSKLINYSSSGGSVQRILPLSEFKFVQGELTI